MIKIEVFSARGCEKCVHSHDTLKQVAATVLGEGAFLWRDVDVLVELNYAVDLGVLSMPAIAVNGRLMFPTLPDEAQWRDTLERLREA